MSDCRNPDPRWPTAEIMRRARHVDETGLIPFVDTEAAARYLALSPRSLECYRSLGGGMSIFKFGSPCVMPLRTFRFGLRSADVPELPVLRLASFECCRRMGLSAVLELYLDAGQEDRAG